jgi:subtilisin family serine protease
MPRVLRYYSGNRKHRLEVQGLFEGRQQYGRRAQAATVPQVKFPIRPQAAGAQVMNLLSVQPRTLQARFSVISESQTMIQPVDRGRTTVIPTETVAVIGAKADELRWVRRQFGLEVVQQGSHGKVLLAVAGDADDPIEQATAAANALFERGNVEGAHPNFLRLIQRPGPATGGASTQWGLDNQGNPGVVGADVAALAAWTITEGDASVRVAVLDEGVDTPHPYLNPGVVAERDFVDNKPTAEPDGDDAHGTACAGIITARGDKVRGLASGASLVAARIAKGDGGQGWIFDDFNTADAIDWCWDDAQSDVLSNSWGGGPPVDVITSAFTRARTQGRGGKGAVVVIAAGNSQMQLSYPGNLPDVLTVGASNQWDKRKTRTSQDGEAWWGSNFGKGLDLMAPGVQILTTDISGARGYDSGLTTPRFNGTSSATPFVAAAAALLISVRPTLLETEVRKILTSTAEPIETATSGWNQYRGYGRLNVFTALRAARKW